MFAHHPIPASAEDFRALILQSNAETFKDVDIGQDANEDILGWHAFLNSPESFRSGFAMRTDVDVCGWESMAWKIEPEDDEGVLYAWCKKDFLTLRVLRGDPRCEALLSQVFGLQSADFPSVRPLENCSWGRGKMFEDAERRWKKVMSEAKPQFGMKVSDLEANLLNGYEEVRPVASAEALSAAKLDTQRAQRVDIRRQAFDAFPAFILTDPDVVRTIDDGKPLVKFFKEKYDIMPSAIKALRNIETSRRHHPAAFSGVFGPDVPSESGLDSASDMFGALLGFCVHNDLEFRLFSPLATRFRPKTLRAFMNIFCYAMDEAGASGAVMSSVLETNGGHRLLRNVCASIDAMIRERARGESSIHERMQMIQPLPIISLSTDIPGLTLRLVSSAEHALIFFKDVGGIFREVSGSSDEAVAGPAFEAFVDGRGSGHYLMFCKNAEGVMAPTHLESRFHKLLVDPPHGFQSMEEALRAASTWAEKDEHASSMIRKLSESRKFSVWRESVKNVADSRQALLRRTGSLAAHVMFGFDDKHVMADTFSRLRTRHDDNPKSPL